MNTWYERGQDIDEDDEYESEPEPQPQSSSAAKPKATKSSGPKYVSTLVNSITSLLMVVVL